MNARARNIVIITLLVAMASITVYIATTGVINRAFGSIEQRDVAQNTSRAVDALKGRIDSLQFKVTDWSSWDDTYAFIEDHNKAYIKSNIQPTSLTNLGINYMLFYNEKQQLVYSKGIDLDSGADLAVPAAFTASFAPGSQLLAANEDSVSKGLVTTPDQTILMVAQPILTSDAKGPLHGTLIFAQVLSPAVVSSLSNVTHLGLNFWRLNDSARPADVASLTGLQTDNATIHALSDTKIAGYQAIADVYGKPALVAKVELPRPIHTEAKHALQQYLTIIILVTAVATLMALGLTLIIRNRERTIELKDEFFSMASHELRSPLTIIRDYAELLTLKYGKKLSDPQFDNIVATIGVSSTQLVGVVNDFLDAARLERGQIPFRIEPFDIREIIDPLAQEYRVVASSKGVVVDVDYPAGLPQVLGDRERVRQIITNLISNALKFTDHGAITVRPMVDGGSLIVYISDTGRGMTKAQQQLLFKKFRQVHSEDSLKGSGLGLFISKMLVEQMGGSIQLESSSVGVGTTISFRLHSIKQRTTSPALAPQPKSA